MDYYKIEFKKKALKDLRKLPVNEIKKINKEINNLMSNPFPFGFKKLKSTEALYRIRVGDYRIIYEASTSNKLIIIQYIRHRKDLK